MGRILKEDDQSNVRPASLDETDFRENAPPAASPRIPADKVNVSNDGPRGPDAPAARDVLRRDQTQEADAPVPVEPPAAPDESSSAGASPAPPGADDGPAAPASTDTADASLPDRTAAEWQDRLDEAVEEARAEGYERGHDDGYDAGYDDGHDAAESALQAEWEDARTALIDDTTRFEEAWAQYVEANETRFVELALTLAEAIVDAPLSDEVRTASEAALTDAVAELASTPPVTVTVHPVDYQRLRESGVAERLIDAHDDVQLESDPERPEGDWDVSSPTGVIRRRRSEVIATLRDRLGLPASGPDSS